MKPMALMRPGAGMLSRPFLGLHIARHARRLQATARPVQRQRGPTWLWMVASVCALVCIRCGGRRLVSRIGNPAWSVSEESCRAIASLVLLALFFLLTASPERSNAQAKLVRDPSFSSLRNRRRGDPPCALQALQLRGMRSITRGREPHVADARGECAYGVPYVLR